MSRKNSKEKSKKIDNSAKQLSSSGEIQILRQELEEKIDQLSATNRQLKRKIFDLYTIFEISRNFNAVLNYQSLLDTFIFTCLGQVGALKGAIFLRHSLQDNMFCIVKYKGSGNFPGPNLCFPTNSRLAEYLTGLNRPVPTSELMTDVASENEKAILKDFLPGIIVPLIYQTRLTGIFAMSEKMSGQAFQLDDLEFLSILSNQIAVAIENARLYEGERNATRQLQAAQQQLVQSEKLAALGEMSAKIAHEVNNPLGIIKNYLLLLQRSLEKNKTATEQVTIVAEEIDRIARIVKQLLKFHRPGDIIFNRIDLCDILESVLTLWEPQLNQNRIQVTRGWLKPCPPINGSSESLRQVFLNMIINARDAMGDAGGELNIDLVRDDKNLMVRFRDTGPGIAPENIPKIFEPFFTTKQEGQGTGLGLSVCYGIIKSHKGSITFRNVDSGGCFEISIPIADKKD